MPTSLTLDGTVSADSAETPSERSTLLIVDDEDGPRQSLKIVFDDSYNLLLASDGSAAVELARRNKVDVAVLDIRMAGMSGIELLGRLKEIDPDIEVIMLTAYETIDTVRQALRHGACDYLNKPFDLATIRAAVATAMERRSLTEEIRSNNQKLSALHEELQNQRLQEEITRTRGEIYASIIHDINGPLTIISGFIQLINQRIGDSKRVEGDDLDMIKDRLKRITRQVTNCIEISQRYLSFMRQPSPDYARVRVNQILEDLRELLVAHPAAHGHQLSVDGLTDDTMVQINGTDLIQILLNLAINGFQSTETEHAVRISSRFLTQPIDLNAMADSAGEKIINRDAFKNIAPLVEFSVHDDGPGIPDDVFPRVFDTYFTTKGPERGTGLGLSIVQRLVKEARGALHLKSRRGEGTTFRLYLPAWSMTSTRSSSQ